MEIKILLFLLTLNNLHKIYAGGINEEKCFDEIFGQRWDEKADESGENETDQNGIIGQTNGQNETNYDENIAQRLFAEYFSQIVDENLELKEEDSEKIYTKSDQLDQAPEKFGQICDHFIVLENKKKIEIVEKFHKIKEKFKQMGKKYSAKEWTKIERKIFKKLGTNQQKIYEWKRQLGLNIINRYSDEEKLEILKQFDQLYDKIKNKLNEKLEGKRRKCQKILAKHLGTNINSIYKWKKQFKNGKFFINQKNYEEKREIVEKYFKIKNEFMQIGKHSRKEWKEFNAKIKQIFGVSYLTIERWAEKLNSNQNGSKVRNSYAEKMTKMKQYYQLKTQKPELFDRKIAVLLKISKRTLYKYKSEFKENAKKFK